MGPLVLWQQWLLGDFVQNIPPLKILTVKDVAHLDALPAQEGERRREARKILADIRFLMNYIEEKVRETGQWTDNHNPTSVSQMYRSVEHLFAVDSSHRASQMKWRTAMNIIRKCIRRA